jgi:hypothetical protein
MSTLTAFPRTHDQKVAAVVAAHALTGAYCIALQHAAAVRNGRRREYAGDEVSATDQYRSDLDGIPETYPEGTETLAGQLTYAACSRRAGHLYRGDFGDALTWEGLRALLRGQGQIREVAMEIVRDVTDSATAAGRRVAMTNDSRRWIFGKLAEIFA